MQRKNSEGYDDPTANKAIETLDREEKHIEKQMNNAIGAIRLMAEVAGFEIVGRIKLRHKESGKEFK